MIVLYFLFLAVYVVTIIGWFAALFTGRLPTSIATFLEGVLRWDIRVVAYATLLDDRYPPFAMAPDAEYPVDLRVSPDKLNRLAVLFRIILVIPAVIVAAVFRWGLGVISFVVWIITLVMGRSPTPSSGRRPLVSLRSRLIVLLHAESSYPSAVLRDGTTEERVPGRRIQRHSGCAGGSAPSATVARRPMRLPHRSRHRPGRGRPR